MKLSQLVLQQCRGNVPNYLRGSLSHVLKDIPRVSTLPMDGFKFIRPEPKGHHEVRLMEAPWGKQYFAKTIGIGEWGKFEAEKENFTSRSALMCLGTDHTPVTYVSMEKKGDDTRYYLLSEAIPKFYDMESFGKDPFFVDKKGITRLRIGENASVITYGRIKTKLVAWMHNVLDPNPENPGLSFQSGTYRVEGAPEVSPHYPIVMLDWEFGNPSTAQKESMKHVFPLYDAYEIAEDLAGEEGVSSVWPSFNKNNLPVLNRRPARRAILETVDNIPIEAWQYLHRQCVSRDYSRMYKEEWEIILDDFATRIFVFKEAHSLIKDNQQETTDDFSDRLKEFSLDFYETVILNPLEKEKPHSRML